MYEIDMDIYRHLRAMEKFVDMRFPYYMEHFPEEEISDEERKEIHMIIDKMKKSYDERILRRAKEAEKAYRDGDVKIGNLEDFWKDMNEYYTNCKN